MSVILALVLLNRINHDENVLLMLLLNFILVVYGIHFCYIIALWLKSPDLADGVVGNLGIEIFSFDLIECNFIAFAFV